MTDSPKPSSDEKRPIDFGLTWENLQPLVWVMVAALLLLLPESSARDMLVGAALTRVRVKL